MKFGLKLWSTNTDLIDQAVKLVEDKIFSYIELLVIPGTQISPFLIDIPYIIHIPHHSSGVNIGDASKKQYNLQKINESIRWADELNARYLILHPGSGLIENVIELLSDITDKRILIENMPKVGLNGEKMIGYAPEQIKKLLGERFGHCLDLGHVIKAAISSRKPYKEFIEDFLKFDPKMFHISDGDIATDKDYHLDIGSGSYDMKFFKNCIENNKSKLVTLETPRNDQLFLDEDLKNITILKSIWNLQK